MECVNCELIQRKFFCERCLRTHVREHRKNIGTVATERDEHINKAKRAMVEMEPTRARRAEIGALTSRIDEVKKHLVALREKNVETQTRILELRARVSSKKDTLKEANRVLAVKRTKLLATSFSSPSTNIPLPPYLDSSRPPSQQHSSSIFGASPGSTAGNLLQAHVRLQEALARARSGLVQELVDVFNIVEVGGRPPLGGKAGTKGEWTIGGLVLPVPGDIRRYPPGQINAVITHTIHFLGLLTYYLGVKLPFQITWTGQKLGVGQASIFAGKGTESGGWARWTSKNPLHLPLTPSVPASLTSDPKDRHDGASPSDTDAMYQSTAELPAVAQPSTSFTTALAMLLYNVAYLAHTQSVEIPLSQTGEVLRNLWAVCCSPELGRRSHETHPFLLPPTPPAFPLDFSQLLQATTANPIARNRAKSSSRTSPMSVRSKSKKQEIITEEEEWDLV